MLNLNVNITPNVGNKVFDQYGETYDSISQLAKKLGVCKDTISRSMKKHGSYAHGNRLYHLVGYTKDKCEENENISQSDVNKQMMSPEFQQFLEYKNASELPFKKVDFKFSKYTRGSRYAVALFSDAHIEETVNPNSVLGLNEYNIQIAKERIEKYFVNLANCIEIDGVENLIFASLGDVISGYIHDELAQSNELTPLEAIFEAQNLIYNGLCHLVKHTSLKNIQFIGIVGNHSRTTKRIQHSNGYKMSYEWLMYKNIQKQCEMSDLPIEFNIPESELAIVDTEDNRRFIFMHGFQIKSSGNSTVCGIYPALNRLSLKYGKTFKQDKIYLGHFHTCTSISNAVVNGSIIGYNAYAISNGFQYEEPAQQYEVYDTNIGLLLNRQIYCK